MLPTLSPLNVDPLLEHKLDEFRSGNSHHRIRNMDGRTSHLLRIHVGLLHPLRWDYLYSKLPTNSPQVRELQWQPKPGAMSSTCFDVPSELSRMNVFRNPNRFLDKKISDPTRPIGSGHGDKKTDIRFHSGPGPYII